MVCAGFSIPMRGNETGDWTLGAPTGEFSIPMRGNELRCVRYRYTVAGTFSIPMRGNELPGAAEPRERQPLVFDPHEG